MITYPIRAYLRLNTKIKVRVIYLIPNLMNSIEGHSQFYAPYKASHIKSCVSYLVRNTCISI